MSTAAPAAARRELTQRLKDRARALGFSLVGVTPADASDHMAFYRSWVERGMHGEMAYLARHDSIARRADLRGTMDDVRSVVVVAHEYGSGAAAGEVDAGGDASRAVIARYARGRDYHEVVKPKLLQLLEWLDSEVQGGASGRAYVDTGPILERDLARRAGLGWFGRNTMLINPRRGSYFFVGILLVDVDLSPDEPFGSDHCGSCRACLEACPTGALLGRDEQGAPVIDARRCISYLTIELRGPIPPELRPAIGNRVFGCDICQEVCPFTRRFSTTASEPAFAARGPGEPPAGVDRRPSDAWHPGTSAPSLVELLTTALDEDAWESFSRGSAIRRARRSGFARNLCVGLGNWGSEDAVPVLRAALDDPEPLVRGHAAWALGRSGSADGADALSATLEIERDEFVRKELKAALDNRTE